MTRKKVKLAWIVNDAARKASLKKRRASLVKKVRELVTLCGVRACIIIYSPDEVKPSTWPESGDEIHALLSMLQRVPELERTKKMMDQEGYIKDRLARAYAQLRKQQRKNKEEDAKYIMGHIVNSRRQVDSLKVHELEGVMWWLQERGKEIRQRVDFPRQRQQLPYTLSTPAASVSTSLPQRLGAASGEGWLQGASNAQVDTMWDEWFTEIMTPMATEGSAAAASASSDRMECFGGEEPRVAPAQLQNNDGMQFGLPRFNFYNKAATWPSNFSS